MASSIPEVRTFLDAATHTFSHVVRDPDSTACAIIDSVLAFDAATGGLDTQPCQALIDYVRDAGLEVQWLLETHVHADHLTAAAYLKDCLGGRTGIGEQTIQLQARFAEDFNFGPEFVADGSQFDRLFQDGDRFRIGTLTARVLSTPGHTPACVSYVIGDAAFVGDTLFMPDSGTARCDFPGGDARTLYRSITRILTLPPQTRLFLCHDYQGGEPAQIRYQTTVAAQREANVHVHEGVTEPAFVALRTERDAALPMPLLFPFAVQVNIRAGRLPSPEHNGQVYLKVPVHRV
ncbi:MBL fold metallo-hydrolase [Marinobacter sp. SS21]|uniref:MBL fold metallo-hydrolase n=1 Tax=Marinobacter sp. SS21 TaxID=2979460 RepID=UPI00232D9353|nr:MBL fold metallo-hydrolase [Marinobacter sp. SS21]MDC0661233.1 MBL fold metallo-hydrolase [Marinobacter sp. SS21]